MKAGALGAAVRPGCMWALYGLQSGPGEGVGFRDCSQGRVYVGALGAAVRGGCRRGLYGLQSKPDVGMGFRGCSQNWV